MKADAHMKKGFKIDEKVDMVLRHICENCGKKEQVYF
jgi:hypothetical protein